MATQSECTICLLDYTEETKKTTECHHIFHQECLNRWLETNNSCPLCRTVLKQVITLPSIWEERQPPSPINSSYFGGGLMQLVAYGAQDRMLTVNTAVTLHQQQEPRRTFNERTRSNQERFAYGRRQFHRK